MSYDDYYTSVGGATRHTVVMVSLIHSLYTESKEAVRKMESMQIPQDSQFALMATSPVNELDQQKHRRLVHKNDTSSGISSLDKFAFV